MINWHPILAAVEIEPGQWRMTAQYEVVYGEIRLARIDGTPCYIATDLNGLEARFGTLRAAAEAVHHVFVRAHSAPDVRLQDRAAYTTHERPLQGP